MEFGKGKDGKRCGGLPRDARVLIPVTYAYVRLHGKNLLCKCDQVENIEGGRFSWIKLNVLSITGSLQEGSRRVRVRS